MRQFEILEPSEPDEFYGPMTYIRKSSVGEHIQDNNGLVLWLCGIYPLELLERLTTVLKEGDKPIDT